jgi:hypothetical protein
MRFAASRRKEMMTQSSKNKGQYSSVGPAQPKGKLRPIYTPRKRFPRNSDIECSAYPSSLLTHIIHLCTPSPLTSRCQLAPRAPSLLAHELTPRRRCAPRRSLRVPPPPPPPPPVVCIPGASSPTRSALPLPPPPAR